ncbi:DUF1127 domain-containing protein [Rhizosaccharibacter radicis]|uniref:DUF1127 domain-containing protein n=1 Tax=Rhizosaccharibacter radicis TaxID=2782605 RepID=A0ABT1VSI2_9PROT|nr:DUF1127 domain-containing protein [Acetobacteraceae bacterium KSS12]
MAYVSAVTASHADLPGLFRRTVEQVRFNLAVRRERARLRTELNTYSDRELADMGLSRADIEGIVARHVG